MSTRPLEPLSPEWWLKRLEAKLYERQGSLAAWDDYYDGNHPLPFLTQAHNAKMHDEFRRLLDESRSNFCRLVVDATEERLQVEGIRLSAQSDAQADQASWDIWQAIQMDQESATAILDALVKGISYISVWPGEQPDDYPVMAVEDALETIVEYTPGTSYRQRDAALKIWEDTQAGVKRANVYLRDGIYKFSAKDDRTKQQRTSAYQYDPNQDDGLRWERLTDGKDFVGNPIGVVPIVPLRNRPRTRLEGQSELKDVFRIQNQINGFLFLLALAGYFGAHKQRWAVGVKMMVDESGNAVEPFDISVDKMLTAEHPDVKFGEFSQTDLDGYIRAIEQKVLHIAVTTRTPRHYLIEQGQSPSGDAIKSAESGLIKKVERKQRPFGEGFEEALILARRFQGDELPPVDSEIVWADAGTPTEAETTDAVIKKFQANLIPREQALEDLGYSQTQIARMMAQAQTDALLNALTNPPPPETPSPQDVVPTA